MIPRVFILFNSISECSIHYLIKLERFKLPVLSTYMKWYIDPAIGDSKAMDLPETTTISNLYIFIIYAFAYIDSRTRSHCP